MAGFCRSLVAYGDVSSVTLEIQGLNLAGKGDEEDAGGFAKTFPDIPCVSQISGGLSLRLSIPTGRLDKVEATLVDWERGIVHCVLIQHLENLSSHSYNQLHSVIPEFLV